tara:strand:+ start:9822 stop:10199 length:378 start_codon:yes stop_codon:yes gene_type:complete
MPFKDPKKLAEYQRNYSRKWYHENAEKQKKKSRQRKRDMRSWYDNLKEKSNCSMCGISGLGNPWMMEFHHREKDKKTKELSYMVSNGYGKEKLLLEIAKCDIVCANCHRKIHYDESLKYKSENNT